MSESVEDAVYAVAGWLERIEFDTTSVAYTAARIADALELQALCAVSAVLVSRGNADDEPGAVLARRRARALRILSDKIAQRVCDVEDERRGSQASREGR